MTPKEAIEIQQKLAGKIVRENNLGEIWHVAGIDVGFEKNGTVTRAAAAVLSFPGLELADYAIARLPTGFPYVPGLLSFREVPAVMAALAKLKIAPGLLLCDGQGIAHPRRIGLASHIGLASGIPSIGVAKTRLIGTHREPPNRRGEWAALVDNDEVIGAVLRTRSGVKPVYVSVGHRVGLETAIGYVMACVTKYRLPETTRWAHRLASGPDPEATGRRGKGARMR